MGRLIVLIGTLLVTMGLVGCGGDPREPLIQNVIGVLNDTASQMRQIKDKLSAALKKEKNFSAEDLKDAVAAAEKIKEENGKNLLELQRRIHQNTDKKPLSNEDKGKYQKKYQSQVEDAVSGLTSEIREVVDLLERAEKKNKLAVQDLKKKLREAQADFEQIAKR